MCFYDGLTVIAEKEKVGTGSWDWEKIYTVGPGDSFDGDADGFMCNGDFYPIGASDELICRDSGVLDDDLFRDDPVAPPHPPISPTSRRCPEDSDCEE